MTTVKTKKNPLIEASKLKNGAPPFDKIKVDDFIPAFDHGIAEAKKNIEKIKSESNPSFENIIEAMESSSEALDTVSRIYGNFSGVMMDDKLDAISEDVSAKLSAFGSDISLDEELFKKVKAVYDKRNQLNLDGDQKLLLEDSYKGFVRNGALLSARKKNRLRQIDTEMGRLRTVFGRNVLNSTNAFLHVVEDEADLAGLPEKAKATAAETAKEKGHDGKWAFTLHAPSTMPVLSYADNRDLRKAMWDGWARRGTEAQSDNRPVLLDIVKLRHERAKMLGFDNHADFVLSERMAGSVKAVTDQINYLKGVSKDFAKKDFDDLKAFIAQKNGPSDIKPWDLGYYVEKMTQEKYGFDDEMLRPYFEYDKVAKGAFAVAGKVYGLEFKESSDYPVYHKDVKTFEVFDKESGDLIGLAYTDFFPRNTKRGGAWMNDYRKQAVKKGNKIIPIIGLHGNFTKPSAGNPSLLTFSEVNTFFHEMGHGLHGLCSNTRYSSQAGTSVKWDFVELPSQLMENWLSDKKVLDMFAKHYQTGDKIPADLFKKMKKAENFRAGSMTYRQMMLGQLDMRWHTTDPSTITDVEAFEREATKEFQFIKPEAGALTSPAFSHIFSGGYSSGYYSYKWAEVLDADAFEKFKKDGLFNKETGKAFRKLMSQGGSRDPMELYKEFRGRKPDADAVLRRDGLLPKKKKTAKKSVAKKPDLG